MEGALNDKGQKKVTDPITGKTRWITMREGKVQSPTGVPVKPEKIEEPRGPKVPTGR
jgi:hypothetical protein